MNDEEIIDDVVKLVSLAKETIKRIDAASGAERYEEPDMEEVIRMANFIATAAFTARLRHAEDAKTEPEPVQPVVQRFAVADPKPRFEKLVDSVAFREFISEVCRCIEVGLKAEIIFDSLQRRYQQGDFSVFDVIDYLSLHPWPQAKTALGSLAEMPNAEAFYERIRDMVNLMRQSAMEQWQEMEQDRRERNRAVNK